MIKKYIIFQFLIIFFASLSAQTFNSTGTVNVPDGLSTGANPIYGATACSPITVAGVGAINGVTNGVSRVCMTITHGYASDLKISLVSPDGTKSLLSYHNGDDGVNFTNTCFSDTAVTFPISGVTAANAPFTGIYEPDLPLGLVNNGQNADGVWRLCVEDGWSPDAGVIVSWSITFSTTIPAPPITICNGTPLARNKCQDATPICNNRVYCGISGGFVYSVDTFAGLTAAFQSRAGATANIEGNSFYKFVASATTATINFLVQGTTTGADGIEVLVMNGGCAAPITTFGYTGNIPVGVVTPVNLTGLTVGNVYTIMIDSKNDAFRNYQFQVSSGVNVYNRTPAIDTVCLGTGTVLTASGGNGTYTWSPSATLSSSTGATVTATPTANTLYTITYGAIPGLSCPTNIDSIRVRVNPLPVVTAPASICVGNTANLTPNSFGTWASSNIAIATVSNSGLVTPVSPGVVTFTFTDTNSCSATTANVNITGPTITPTFAAIAPFCVGATAPLLATTSINGITGTWSPTTINNSSAGTYIFTPTPGQCAASVTINVTPVANVTPTFTPITPFCSGAVAPILPNISNNGITGTWSPATVSNTTSATYTFTPNAGQCATNTTLNVTVNPIITPTVTCGGTTINSVQFNWNTIAGATGFNIVYQVNAGPNNTATLGNVNTYSVTGLTNGDVVTIQITPTGSGCYATGNGSCTASPCTAPTVTLTSTPASTAQTVCINTAITNITYSIGGSATGASATGLPAGVTGVYNAGVFTISGTPSIANTYNYTVTSTGGCSASPVLTGTITVTPLVTPTFNAIAPICSGATAPSLPLASTNGITGFWAPAIVSNSATATYTFTPNAGQCASTATLTVTVNSPVTPTFNAVPAFCAGGTAPVLPTSSTNGISGVWTPATVSNAASATYTFTPNAGQCATSTTLNVTVTPATTPTFAPILPFCAGATAPVLPLTSTNGITGTWNPAVVSNTTSGSYTFTPNAGQCATPINLPIIVAPTPTVNLGNDTIICTPNTLVLNATNLLSTYVWQDGSNAATYTVTQPGNYSVVVTNAIGCSNTDNVDVTFSQKVNFTLGRDTTLCTGQTLVLDPNLINTTGLTFTWQDGSAASSYTVNQPGIYYLDVTNECGPSRDSITVAQGVCKVFIPNVFTPNADGKNDVFKPLGTEFVTKIDVKVFNRFGQLVYSTNKVGAIWNGKIQGKDAPVGTYAYIIKYTESTTNVEKLVKGTLMLLR
jgi:gliding motility-associated-like protein